MTANGVPHVVLLSDNVWERRKDELLRANPSMQPIVYVGNDPLPEDVIPTLTTAFFSGDLWPERARGFMLSALQAPNLTWLHTFSAGVDNPVFGTFRERGIRLTTSSGSSASPIAQTVFTYILALSRNLPLYLENQRNHLWQPHMFQELEGSTLAVIGYGPIGEHVVRIGLAMNMNVVTCRRTPSGNELCPTYPLSDLHNTIAHADWVVLALPLTEDTRGIFNGDAMAAMKPGAGFVNIGRGELVDETALISALGTGHIGCAGLDVFAEEPLSSDSALWDMPNVIITPHASGVTAGSYLRAESIFVANMDRLTRGESLLNEVF
jgi:phosphoglycerate dehydrogenase-like enzyme